MVNKSEIQEKCRGAETIHFVCSGNIIRSSFADLLTKHKGVKNVKSYGTTYHNSSIHTRSQQELESLGVDISLIESFRPTHIDNAGPFDPMDLHVVMTHTHRSQLLNHGISADRIMLITELIGREDEVADPYFEGNYDEAYSTIRDAVNQLVTFVS